MKISSDSLKTFVFSAVEILSLLAVKSCLLKEIPKKNPPLSLQLFLGGGDCQCVETEDTYIVNF